MVRPDVIMPIAIARLLRDGEIVYHTHAGILPMIAVQLARRLHAPDLVYVNPAGSINPPPEQVPRTSSDPTLLAGTCVLLTPGDISDMAARGRLDTALLGATRIDSNARVDTDLPPGGARTTSLLNTARRSIFWLCRHDPQTTPEQLDTHALPSNLSAIVTPLCILQPGTQRLHIASIHPDVTFDQLRTQTGFALELSPELPQTPTPTIDELNALAAIDPAGLRKIAIQQ
jgi:glutaconate CoA-transferase, subunit B